MGSVLTLWWARDTTTLEHPKFAWAKCPFRTGRESFKVLGGRFPHLYEFPGLTPPGVYVIARKVVASPSGCLRIQMS